MTEANEYQWSLQAAISPEVQLALNFKTNPANYESHWTTVWHKGLNELLRRIELPETPPSERFTATSQYSLVQRGKTRSQSVPLQATTIDKIETDSDSHTDEESDAEKQIPKTLPLRIEELEEGELTSDTDDLNRRLGGLKLNLNVFSSSAIAIAPEVPEAPEPSLQPLASPINPTASRSPNDQSPQTPPRRQQDDTPAEPSSSRTCHVQSGRDSRFWVDIALVKGKCVGEKVSHILGYRVCPHIPQAPMLLEAKRSPSRSRSRASTFEIQLNGKFLAAYGDIHLKAPVALKTHQEQKSIIALACSGPWWSFTVIDPTTQTVAWSQIFELGHTPHDGILMRLVEAAVDSPEDPAAHKKNTPRGLLTSYGRGTYKKNEFAPVLIKD